MVIALTRTAMSRLPYLLLTVCIGLAPVHPAHAVAHAAAPARDDMGRAEQLYLEGKEKFEIAEYIEALRLWQEAYGLVPDTKDARPIKNDLIYNMAKAQVKAHAVDNDVARLRKAKLLFEQYLGEHESLHGKSKAAVKEREEVAAQLAEVEKLLENPSAGPAAVGVAPGDPDAAPPGDPSAAPPGDPSEAGGDGDEDEDEDEDDFDLDAALDADPELAKEYKQGRDMVIAGSVVLGVGLFSLLVAAGGVGAAINFDNMGETDRAQRLTYASIGVGAFGGVATISGAVVLGLGIPRLVRAKKRAQRQSAFQPSFTPYFTRGGAGAVATIRF